MNSNKVVALRGSEEHKKYWQRIIGPGSPSMRRPGDVYQRTKNPPEDLLINSVYDTVAAALSLIGNRISTVKPHLMHERKATSKALNQQTRKLNKKELDRLHIRANMVCEEVLDHAALRLIKKPNALQGWGQFARLTQYYKDVCGPAYWHLVTNEFNSLPAQLIVLPSQYIHPVGNAYGIDHFETTSKLKPKYDAKEIIYIQSEIDGENPYLSTKSPLSQIFDRVQIQSAEVGYLRSTLENNAKPDAVFIPEDPDGIGIGPEEAERMSKELNQRFRGPANGGTLVLPFKGQLQPLGWRPRDLAELDLYNAIKQAVCDAFHIPVDIFQATQGDRGMYSAEYSLSHNCIKPRLDQLAAVLNDQLLPLFADSEGMFFVFDDLVIEDKEFEHKKSCDYLDRGVYTRAFVQEREGIPSQSWATQPLIPNGMVPASVYDRQQEQHNQQMAQAEQQPAQAEDTATPAVASEPAEASTTADVNSLRASVGGSQAILQIQIAANTGQISVAQGRANLVNVFGYSPAEAAEFLPDPVPLVSVAATATTAPPSSDVPEDKPTAPPPDTEGNDKPASKPEGDQAEAEAKSIEVAALVAPEVAPHVKYIRFKAIGKPTEEGLQNAIQRFFSDQYKQVKGKIKRIKAPSQVPFFDPEAQAREMYNLCLPEIRLAANWSAQNTVEDLQQFGVVPELFRLTQPKVNESCQALTLAFCQSTNDTVHQALNEAQDNLRQSLLEGTEQGDSRNALMKRVQEIYDTTNLKAFEIAVTEQSRAIHAAQDIVAQDSDGVVKGWKWLLSDDACPVCLQIAAENPEIQLGGKFTTLGAGPYADVPYPPAHVGCRCTTLAVVD